MVGARRLLSPIRPTYSLARYVLTVRAIKIQLTSGRRPLKMQRLKGRLREVVVYKNRTTRGLFQEEVRAHLLYGR